MESNDEYDDLLNRAASKLASTAWRTAAENDAASDHLTDLLIRPASERLTAVAMEPRFQTYSLAVHILERSEAAIAHHPRAALELTRLARAIVIHIPSRTCGGAEARADLGAYALAREGNAQRVCGDMSTALNLFTHAREVQKRGGVDSHLTAKIDLLESSLRRDIGQLQAALSLLDRAAESLLALGEREKWVHAEINRSNVFLVQEDFERAATILEDMLQKTSNPQTVLLIRHNLSHLLALSGRPCEAARLLESSRDLYRWFSDPLITNRRLWVEGLIACGLGEDRLAGNLFSEVGARMDERGYAFDAALVRLELGKLLASQSPKPVC